MGIGRMIKLIITRASHRDESSEVGVPLQCTISFRRCKIVPSPRGVSESSRWVVPLIASFQDANNLYLVMDYMVGGDFLRRDEEVIGLHIAMNPAKSVCLFNAQYHFGDVKSWVVPLIASFQDANNLYLVMDYMVGGDFLGLLIRKNGPTQR
jgi:serine/threonine protein kinase